MPELGIGQAQGMASGTLRIAVSRPMWKRASAGFRDDIITPVLGVEDGCLHPRLEAGLGFEVSEPKLKEYAVRT